MKEKGKMLKEKVKQKKGRNKNKKWMFFVWVFFVVFHEERKGFLKEISKIVEKSNGFFAHEMFLNEENRNRKQKRVFTTFHDKNTFLFLDTSKGRKKRDRVEKKNKKKAGYKNEKPFFQDTEKDQTWKNM